MKNNLSFDHCSRRDMLRVLGAGFGSLAFAGMTSGREAHLPARAKRVIFLFMHGGVSQVDSFDYKPELQARHGQKLPFAPARNLDASATAQAKLMKSPWAFKRHGDAGLWVSDLFPNLAGHADKLCVVKSVHSMGQSHGQAVCMLHTGTDNFVRPSVGAWVSYGLGTENANLPSFITISPSPAHGGPRNYGAAFLPARHQATVVGRDGKLDKNAGFAYLGSSSSDTLEAKKRGLLQNMNAEHLSRTGDRRVGKA